MFIDFFFVCHCVCLCIICFFPSSVNSTVYTLMYVHIFGYIVNKLEICWVYLSLIDEQLYIRSIRFYTLCLIHLIILSELYSIMHYIIQISVLVIRWLTLEIHVLMQLILLSMIQILFFHTLMVLAPIIILPIVQLLTTY